MKPTVLLMPLVLLGMMATASAEGGDFTPEDDIAMSRCVDLVRQGKAIDDKNAAPESPPSLSDCIGTISEPCMETPEGMSTIGMSSCLIREATWWDDLLNQNYLTLRETLDSESFAALRDAQRAWIAYSAANCDFHYTYWREGTIRSTMQSSCVLETNAKRAIELDDFINWQ